MRSKQLSVRVLLLLFFSLLLVFLFLRIAEKSSAFEISNESLRIELNRKPNRTPTPTLRPLPTTRPPALSEFTAEKHPKDFLRFGVSEALVDFGILSPTSPTIRQTMLSLLTTTTNRTIIQVLIDTEPRNEQSSFIPGTTCDDGSCNESKDGPWKNVLTYGIGFRCASPTPGACIGSFESPDNYKQFPSLLQDKYYLPVLESILPEEEILATIEYKINIAGTQQSGIYTHTISYIATPGY